MAKAKKAATKKTASKKTASKKTASKKTAATKTTEAQYKAMAAALPGKLPETIGEHFRARIVQGKLDNAAILKEVTSKHKDCKATMSSLYWNRQYLMNHDGIKNLPTVKAAG